MNLLLWLQSDKLFGVQGRGFEPGAKPWQGLVLPGYTTPAFAGKLTSQMFATLGIWVI